MQIDSLTSVAQSDLSRRRFLRLAASGVASVSALGLLAACGEDEDDDDNAAAAGDSSDSSSAPTDTPETEAGEEDDPTSAEDAAEEAVNDPTETEEEETEPTEEEGNESGESSIEEFIVAATNEPLDILPWFGSYDQALVTRQIYQTLVEPRLTINDRGTVDVELMPQLAEAWELIDDTTWRFTLREGVTFHNGEPFNAESVIASLEAMNDPDVLEEFGKTTLLFEVESWEAVDDMTVDITLFEKNIEFPGLYLRIGFSAMPAGVLAESGIAGLADHPIGTGPYQFESWERGQEIRLSKFEDYWKGDEGPNMPAVRYIFRPEAAVRAQTVAAGEAHFAYNLGIEQAETLDSYVIGAGFQSSSIRINNTISPTEDERLRKAINYAIDRDAIVESIFGGAAVPLAFFGFQPVELEPYEYDLERAAALVEEAGLSGTELELVYGEGRIPEEDQLAEIYKAAFEAIGLAIKLTKLEPRQYNELGGMPFEEQPPLYMETTSSGNFGDIASGLRDKYGCEGTGAHCDPDLDEEFAQLGTLEGEERLELLQSLAERLHERAPRAWVAAVQQVHGLAENVETDFPANTYLLFDDIRVV